MWRGGVVGGGGGVVCSNKTKKKHGKNFGFFHYSLKLK
jgi:hypothetical protein